MATIDELAKKNALDAQAQSDRASVGDIVNTVKDANNRAGAAIADLASMPVRGAVGAYDSAVVRPMRAAGINADYLSPLVTPNGADPASATPFYDRIAAQDAAPKVNPTPGVSPTGGVTGITKPNAIASLAANPVQQAGAIQPQAATAPAAAPTPIQKLGVRRQPPLNVPLQQNAGISAPVVQNAAAPQPIANPNDPEPVYSGSIGLFELGVHPSQMQSIQYQRVVRKDGIETLENIPKGDPDHLRNLQERYDFEKSHSEWLSRNRPPPPQEIPGSVEMMRSIPDLYNKDGSLFKLGGIQQTLAMPRKPGEAFMREVPVQLGGNIAAIGKYQAAQSQGAINNADPTTATNVQRDKELAATLANAQSIANINKDSHLGGAGISAGASKYSADKSAETQIGLEASRADAIKKNLVMNPEQVGIDLMGSPIIKDVPYIRNADGTLKKAIQSSAAPAIAPPPKTGTVVDGYKFKGGNPSDKKNWEKN